MPALIFDCDGVLADTERDGHLPAFNQTFEDVGLAVRWSPEEYGEKLLIGGGKERMASLLTPEFVAGRGPARRSRRPARAARRLAQAKDGALQAAGAVRCAARPARDQAHRPGRRARPAGNWRWPRPRPRNRCGRCWSTWSANDCRGRFRRARGRRRARQEAGARHLPAGDRPARCRCRRRAGDRGLAQRPAGGGRRPVCAAW